MMKQTNKIIVLLMIPLILLSCENIVLSPKEKDYLIEITESEGFDYLFVDEGLTVRIFNSKIVGTNDISNFSPIVASFFFRMVVSQKRTINAKGKVRLEYINNEEEVFISETPYSEIIVLEKLISVVEKIINNYPSDEINSLINNREVKKQIDSIVRPYEIKNINIYKYKINTEKKVSYLYWMIGRDNSIDKIKTIFDESNKLVNIKVTR